MPLSTGFDDYAVTEDTLPRCRDFFRMMGWACPRFKAMDWDRFNLEDYHELDYC